MNRREFCSGALLAGTATALWLPSGAALAQSDLAEGRHYVRLAQPAPVSAPSGKIEVLEFFSYGCPHCNAFEPSLEAWTKKLPADVAFRRIPVNFLANYENYQRLYYSLEALGQVEAMQRKVFAAVHVTRERLGNADQIADFVAKNGVDRAKFLDLFNAFGIQNKLVQSKQLVERYKIDGVPALGVHGRFFTSPSMAGGEGAPPEIGHARALAAVDMLVDRLRKGG